MRFVHVSEALLTGEHPRMRAIRVRLGRFEAAERGDHLSEPEIEKLTL
jgi:hypothetical protein